MKRYRPVSQLLAEIEQVLEAKYSPRSHPVEQVLGILQEGRNYSHASVFLALESREQRQFAGKELTPAASAEGTIRRIVVPIKLPGVMLGVLHVETKRPNGFFSTDRMFLVQVAARLARFLTTNGKYVLRRAKLEPVVVEEPAPGHSSTPKTGVPGTPAKTAAAGDKSRL